MKNTIVIALVGKGGVGKTSISALTVRLLAQKYPDKKRFYNKCWGQAMSLAPTFIIEPVFSARYTPRQKIIPISLPPVGGKLCEAFDGLKKSPCAFRRTTIHESICCAWGFFLHQRRLPRKGRAAGI